MPFYHYYHLWPSILLLSPSPYLERRERRFGVWRDFWFQMMHDLFTSLCTKSVLCRKIAGSYCGLKFPGYLKNETEYTLVGVESEKGSGRLEMTPGRTWGRDGNSLSLFLLRRSTTSGHPRTKTSVSNQFLGRPRTEEPLLVVVTVCVWKVTETVG